MLKIYVAAIPKIFVGKIFSKINTLFETQKIFQYSVTGVPFNFSEGAYTPVFNPFSGIKKPAYKHRT